ncbi:hypothetical protein B0J13DRAFT_600025 [Dactylonectria estremocensis]|uniref:Uncharacterized protein n=1 Tax=Dactylonectria estremocensis TaxID=1079267 RepID=A0A9P9DAV1_9HYPO|nr:hypothetical protein B0J13DRAFT_600025 [Dactylonectria estremocensis]
MASATTSPPAVPDPFDLGIRTPANINRGTCTALLQNSPAVLNGPVGVPPVFGRTAQTPSSPLNAISTAAATEGAQVAFSIIESANRLARERVEEYNAKLKVFQAFCTKFEDAAKQFTTGLEREFAEKFTDSFLDVWSQALTDAKSAPVPAYSTVAASPPANTPLAHQHQQQEAIRSLQGQPTPIAPPREDLQVFVRLEADAPARNNISYAIRTHISG